MPTFLLPTIVLCCIVICVCLYFEFVVFRNCGKRKKEIKKTENFLNTKTFVFEWGIFLTFCIVVLETDLQIMDLSCSNEDENNVATSNIIS